MACLSAMQFAAGALFRFMMQREHLTVEVAGVADAADHAVFVGEGVDGQDPSAVATNPARYGRQRDRRRMAA